MDSIVNNQVEQCRVYDLAAYANERTRESKTELRFKSGGHSPARILHVCPSYAAGFSFYRAELSVFRDRVLTQIVTLLSSNNFDPDQRWELLQFVTQANFAKLSDADQLLVLSMIERTPTLSIHLLLAMLNNRLKKRSTDQESSESSVTLSAPDASPLNVPAQSASLDVEQFMACLDYRRFPPSLYEDIATTLHLLLDTHKDSRVAFAYVSLVQGSGFLGSFGQLGMHINRLIQQDVSLVSSAALQQLGNVLSTTTFATLLLGRQRVLLDSMRNLSVLEWPNAVEHLSALAIALKGASRAELAALQRYFAHGRS